MEQPIGILFRFTFLVLLHVDINNSNDIADVQEADLKNSSIVKISIIQLSTKICGCSTPNTVTTTISNNVIVSTVKISDTVCKKICQTGNINLSEIDPRMDGVHEVKFNAMNNFTYNETRGSDIIIHNILFTLINYTTRVNLATGKVILPNEYDDCYYENFTCYISTEKAMVFWDKPASITSESGDFCDSFFVIYEGPAKNLTGEVLIENSNKTFALKMADDVFLCNRLSVVKTDNEMLLITFEQEIPLELIIPLLGREVNPLNAFPFREKKDIIQNFTIKNNANEAGDIENQTREISKLGNESNMEHGNSQDTKLEDKVQNLNTANPEIHPNQAKKRAKNKIVIEREIENRNSTVDVLVLAVVVVIVAVSFLIFVVGTFLYFKLKRTQPETEHEEPFLVKLKYRILA